MSQKAYEARSVLRQPAETVQQAYESMKEGGSRLGKRLKKCLQQAYEETKSALRRRGRA